MMHRVLSFTIKSREGPDKLTGSVANCPCALFSRQHSAGWTSRAVTEGVGNAWSTTSTNDTESFSTGERCRLGSDRSTVTTRRHRPSLVWVLADGPNRASTAYASGSEGPPECRSWPVGSWEPTRESSTMASPLYSISFAASRDTRTRNSHRSVRAARLLWRSRSGHPLRHRSSVARATPRNAVAL